MTKNTEKARNTDQIRLFKWDLYGIRKNSAIASMVKFINVANAIDKIILP